MIETSALYLIASNECDITTGVSKSRGMGKKTCRERGSMLSLKFSEEESDPVLLF